MNPKITTEIIVEVAFLLTLLLTNDSKYHIKYRATIDIKDEYTDSIGDFVVLFCNKYSGIFKDNTNKIQEYLDSIDNSDFNALLEREFNNYHEGTFKNKL